MHSMAVFSWSTTTASLFRPRMTEMAVSYFRCVGLHRSKRRPRTLGTMRIEHRILMQTCQEIDVVDLRGFPFLMLLAQILFDRPQLGEASDGYPEASRLILFLFALFKFRDAVWSKFVVHKRDAFSLRLCIVELLFRCCQISL